MTIVSDQRGFQSTTKRRSNLLEQRWCLKNEDSTHIQGKNRYVHWLPEQKKNRCVHHLSVEVTIFSRFLSGFLLSGKGCSYRIVLAYSLGHICIPQNGKGQKNHFQRISVSCARGVKFQIQTHLNMKLIFAWNLSPLLVQLPLFPFDKWWIKSQISVTHCSSCWSSSLQGKAERQNICFSAKEHRSREFSLKKIGCSLVAYPGKVHEHSQEQ